MLCKDNSLTKLLQAATRLSLYSQPVGYEFFSIPGADRPKQTMRTRFDGRLWTMNEDWYSKPKHHMQLT
jgi:hypothetical protein